MDTHKYNSFSLLKTFILTIFLATILGCSNGDDSEASPVQNATTKGDLPPEVIEDLSEGLKGIDADQDGIRDDVNKLIEIKFSSTEPEKKVATQYAAGIQKFMEAATKEQALSGGDSIGKSIACISKVLPSRENYIKRQDLIKEIEALTINTRERFVANLQANKLASGGYFSGYGKNIEPCE